MASPKTLEISAEREKLKEEVKCRTIHGSRYEHEDGIVTHSLNIGKRAEVRKNFRIIGKKNSKKNRRKQLERVIENSKEYYGENYNEEIEKVAIQVVKDKLKRG